MEIVDYEKTKGWEIATVTDGGTDTAKGFIIRLVGVSGRETKIICTPDELRELKQGFEDVLK